MLPIAEGTPQGQIREIQRILAKIINNERATKAEVAFLNRVSIRTLREFRGH